MIKRHITLIIMTAAVALCASIPAAAMVLDSNLTGPLGPVSLNAEAVFADGVWTYTYTADISQLSRNVTGFSVGNLDRGFFFNTSNDHGFVNPVFEGTDSIMWTAGAVAPGDGPLVFVMQSELSPTRVDTTVWGGAFPTTGTTLGLVPEPSGIAALGMFGLGAMPFFVRKRAK